MEVTEIILARGHENIQALHKTTFEITKEKQVSAKGDCIIAVSADKALSDLSLRFKKTLCRERAKLTVLIEAGGEADIVKAYGSPRLILDHPTDIVVRKSSYICNRTLAIQADKAACDLSRKLVERLRDPKRKVKITLTVET